MNTELEQVIASLPQDMQEIFIESFGTSDLSTIENQFTEINVETKNSIPTNSILIENTNYEIVDLQDKLVAIDDKITPILVSRFEEDVKIDNVLQDSIKIKIEENIISSTLIDERTLRFSGADWFAPIQSANFTIIGAGGIGSWVSLLLSKVGGTSMQIFDGDKYDASNIAGQLCYTKRVGANKASALKDLIRDITGFTEMSVEVYSYNWEIMTNYDIFNPIVLICAVDNMATRKKAFLEWQNLSTKHENSLFIDARLTADTYQIYTIKPNDSAAHKRYLNEWFSDNEADELPCSFKQTAYMAAGLASRIVNNIVNNFIPIENTDEFLKNVPFFIEFNSNGYQKIDMYA